MAEELNREREGLQLAKMFLDYCFRCDMLTMDSPVGIIEKLKEYAFKICDDCGGAMCDDHCPASRYKEDKSRRLQGERTVFATDRTKQRNCDVGTPEEQSSRFLKFCESHPHQDGVGCRCANCELDAENCELAWAQMPYESMEEQNDSKRT